MLSTGNPLYFFNWSIGDLQCYINFCCTVKSFSYTGVYILFKMFLSITAYHGILNMPPCAIE